MYQINFWKMSLLKRNYSSKFSMAKFLFSDCCELNSWTRKNGFLQDLEIQEVELFDIPWFHHFFIFCTKARWVKFLPPSYIFTLFTSFSNRIVFKKLFFRDLHLLFEKIIGHFAYFTSDKLLLNILNMIKSWEVHVNVSFAKIFLTITGINKPFSHWTYFLPSKKLSMV